MLYLYTVQNGFVVHKLQHLLTASFLHAMYILLPCHPPSFTGYKSYSAYLPNVVLLCCSPACFSAPWVEWKCVKSLGSVMSLGCKWVSPEPWRLARASKFEDAWVLGILKGAVAFKNQDQEHTSSKVRTPKRSWQLFQAVYYHFTFYWWWQT